MKRILMKRIKRHQVMLMGRWLFSMAICLLILPLLPACTDDHCNGNSDNPTQGDTYIHLNVGTDAFQSRAAEKGADAESQIHTLRVWAFDSEMTDDSATPLSYKEELSLQENSNQQLSIKLPRKSGGKELKHIDLFILANGESGSTLAGDYNKKQITRQELREAKFTQSFTINETSGKPLTTQVPATGLPISRYVTQIAVDDYKSETPNASAAKPLSIALLRGVNKMHFYFTKESGAFAADAEVSRIELDENTLSWGGYAFPDAAPLSDLATQGLKASGAQDYIQAKAQPDSTVAYYNETLQPLSGTIYYKMYKTAEERQATFAYPAGTAIRNHELVVHGHFNGNGELQLQYDVLPWTQRDINVETKDLSYLNVYPNLVLMKNVATSEEVNFFASDACTAELTEVYYYDKHNQKQLITPSDIAQYPSISLDGIKSGKLQITSPVPTNKTVKYIQVRIRLNGSTQHKDVTIKQYPLEYAQNIVGLYSSRSKEGWVSPDKEGGTYQDYPYGSGWSSGYGYSAKIYQDGDIKYYKGGKTVGGTSGNSNNLMYVIQITSTNGKYVIAHPKLKADGTSDDHVVSPAFMIASQLGAVFSDGFDATSAIEHSKTYREVAADGTVYDNWRLPTKEEIAIIIDYQGKPNSPIDNVLTGANYRTLSKETVATGITGANSGYFVRCIRDLTPEEVAKLEQNK